MLFDYESHQNRDGLSSCLYQKMLSLNSKMCFTKGNEERRTDWILLFLTMPLNDLAPMTHRISNEITKIAASGRHFQTLHSSALGRWTTQLVLPLVKSTIVEFKGQVLQLCSSRSKVESEIISLSSWPICCLNNDLSINCWLSWRIQKWTTVILS